MEQFKVLPKNDIQKLPSTTGVYCFIEKNEPIYIGKAINIKERVKNHFQQPTYKDNFFTGITEKIGFIETGSEIEALVLEASLIKKYQPKFNQVWRDDKNYFYVAVENKKRPILYICHQKKEISAKYIGPFTEGNSLKKTLKFLRKVFPFYTSAKHSATKCTWCHLGLCPGPNPNLAEYKKNIKKLVLILQGKRKTVLYSLKKEMKDYSNKKEFEKALEVKNKILALEQVMAHTNVIQNAKIKNQNVPDEKWIKTEKILREILQIKTPVSKIECYDISNIQGTQAVGAMVVFVNGAPDKSQYKKFSIRFEDDSNPNLPMTSESTNDKEKRPYELLEKKPNDIAMLQQVLTRRLAHPEWGYPDVMLIDGGIAQLNVGIKMKKEFLLNQTIVHFSRKIKNIKIISIAKGKRELLIEGPASAEASVGKVKKIPLKNLPQEIYNLIVHLDDEAHRFAITYHKKLRKKYLLK